MKINTKQNTSRRAIAILLALGMLLSSFLVFFTGCETKTEFALPMRTLPENAEQQKFSSFRYKVYDDDTVLLTEYKGEESEVVIPDTIEGKKVVALGDEMFYENRNLTSIQLGKYVESVGAQCFTRCVNLETITLSECLWSIAAYAFDGTPWLENLVNPPKPETPAETTADGETVPVETEVQEKNPADDFLIVGDGVLLRYLGNDKNIVIPDTVRHIANAFTMTDIISVQMPDSVYTIGEFAFAFCESMALIEFSKNLLLIGEGAFYGCFSLPSVILPEKLEVIESMAFYECKYMTNVRCNDNLRSIGECAFYNCMQLRMVYLPVSITVLPTDAFGECLVLELVLYGGDEAAFKAIKTDSSNYPLLDATIVYNATRENGR